MRAPQPLGEPHQKTWDSCPSDVFRISDEPSDLSRLAAGKSISRRVPTTTLDDYLLPRLKLRRDDAFGAHIKVPYSESRQCSRAAQSTTAQWRAST